ncbi:MerR family transcriptional regulator [Gorillibacterium sp. CAU 1737]|uniref:MerR family transcriptional regulator n=1 Tax=Gorillibacterium sp. CAU 1737 TaxID=3140362 RepID=UPI003260E8F1
MLKIGDFSRLSRVSIRMLRHYDEIGLLVPESIDAFTGYRYYSESQLPLANRIDSFKQMGFSLAVIADILSTCSDADALNRYLLIKRTELNEQAGRINRQLQELEATLSQIRKDEYVMEYVVTVKEMPQRQVASLRRHIPAYDQEAILWEELMRELTSRSISYSTPCYSLAVFHDAQHQEENPDVEVQISVQGSYASSGSVQFKQVPSALIASATYNGGYDQLVGVNQAVAQWVRDHDYEFDGAMFLIYHVSPSQTKNPEEWVTEVCFPVKKKA